MVTKEIVKNFPAAHDTDLSCMQTDIAGFYNQVEHIRTIESDVHCYICLAWTKCGFHAFQAHVYQNEMLRVLRGQWREKTKLHRSLHLGDINPICNFPLKLEPSFLYSRTGYIPSTPWRKHGGSAGPKILRISCP